MGTVLTAIQSLLGWDKSSVYNKRFVNANSVLFSSFGNDITASDIVKTAIHRVAEEVSKCNLKSIIEHQNPHRVEVSDDDINAVFASRVNPLCGLKDFLYKVAWLTLVNKNCFIYWQYDEIPIASGYVKRVTKGFYPIEYANVKMYMLDGEMRVELSNATGDITLDLPYSDVIHVRLGYGANKFLGGNKVGRGDYKNLLDNLQTMHVIKEAIPKSLEASLSLKGVLSMKTVADADKKTVTREEFENHLFNSQYGIVATDYEADFQPVNISATDIPQNILTFLRDELLSPFGVSLPIYLGKYTDDEYTSFYQTGVEGLLMAIAEAMTIVLYTPRQLAYGHKVKCYDKVVQSLSYDRRQKLVEITKEDALLSRSERRELLGYEPDGEPTRVSLNFVDTMIANEYQLKTLQNKQAPPAPTTGKNNPDSDSPTDSDNNTTEDDET